MKKIINLIKKNSEIIRYLIVGVITMIITLLTFSILTLTILDSNNSYELQIANIVSWILAVLFSYIANRKYVFKSKSKNVTKEMFKFFASRLFSLIIDMLLMYITVTILRLNDQICKISVQVIITIINYIISKYFAFKGVEVKNE